MWIEQICRLCFQNSDILFPIFATEGDRPHLDIKIKKCLSLTINETDFKPKSICFNCVLKLEEYHEFLETCHMSDSKFDSILLSTRRNTVSEKEQQNQISENHDSVIVVGKIDESQNLNRDCQDILLMVELKCKEAEFEQQNETDQNKEMFALPQSVLRHSDDFKKSNKYLNESIDAIKVIKSVKSKPFPCTLCNKSFMRRSNLNAHMAVHTQIRPYHCEQCDRSFAIRWNLTVHQRLHTGLYSCDFCGKAFSAKGKLERHRRTHTGEKPYSCNIPNCNKAFSDKRNLEAHVRTHSEERPFACSICSRRFRSKSHLIDHRRVHSTETPFSCSLCGKSFKWKNNLTIHMKNHTGEKSVCKNCGKQFVRPSQLAKHVKKQHSNSEINILCKSS